MPLHWRTRQATAQPALIFGQGLRLKTACPPPQTPLYVRRLSLDHFAAVRTCKLPIGLQHVDSAWILCLRDSAKRRRPQVPFRALTAPDFRSLRLSVRTPPFHGGESGSIPLGSAKNPLNQTLSSRWVTRPIHVITMDSYVRDPLFKDALPGPQVLSLALPAIDRLTTTSGSV